MITGKKEVGYLGKAALGDYINGECRNKLIIGKVYEVTFDSNWVGSFVLIEIEADDVKIITKKACVKDPTAFRYSFKEGFEADWLILDK